MMPNKAYCIILDDRVLPSKKKYASWWEIQEEYYEKYKTNFPPATCEELIQYFEEDYGTRLAWPFSKTEIIQFYAGNSMVLYSGTKQK